MIAEDRGCHEVLTQLAAVKAAVVQAAMTILGAQLARYVQEGTSAGRSGQEAMEEFMEVFKKFSSPVVNERIFCLNLLWQDFSRRIANMPLFLPSYSFYQCHTGLVQNLIYMVT